MSEAPCEGIYGEAWDAFAWAPVTFVVPALLVAVILQPPKPKLDGVPYPATTNQITISVQIP